MTDPAFDATLPPPDAATRGFPEAAGPPARWDGRVPWQLGRYRVERKLGEGGMGAVYHAHDEHLDRAVALKIPFLRDGVTDPLYPRFLREGRAAAGLRHPNICPIYDLGEIDGIPYLSMALIRGEPLARRVGPGRPMHPREAVTIVRKVALAMAEAHERKVIHRDLKPVNIVLDEAGEPIVLDFGLARRDDAFSAMTLQGQVMGTPAYMPPEQLNGEVNRMGPCSDVYGLGVVLYELLSGNVPFHGDLLAIAGQVMCDPPPPLTGVEPELARVCLRALAKAPEDRWPTMRAFAEALAKAEGRLPDAGPRAAHGLTLRVDGTPHAYRADPAQRTISVGRQRRRLGDPADVGNDFVVRVAGNEELSTRISRRHLEVARTAGGYVVTDRSKAGTQHNGQPLLPGLAMALVHGDRLTIAGVVTLVVELDGRDATASVGEVAVPVTADRAAQVLLEATVGAMVNVG